jgi:hypothetical protein
MTVRAFPGLLLSATIFIGAGGGAAYAQTCTAADFGSVVDQTAQALRELNGSGSKRFQTRVAALREKHRLSQEEIDARTTDLHDEKIGELNREIESLVAQMDVLSQTPNSKITCEKLEELKRVRDRLLTVMGQKSGYMLAKVEAELEGGAKGSQRVAAATPPVTAPQPEPVRPAPVAALPESKPLPAPGSRAPLFSPDAKPLPLPTPITTPAESKPLPTEDKPRAADWKPVPAPEAPANIKPSGARTAALDPAPPPAALPDLPERSPGGTRTARSAPPDGLDRAPPPPPMDRDGERPTSLAPPPGGGLALPPPGDDLPPPVAASEEGYSINDIRDAGKGVFGTITAEFAGAINYAFQQFGKPNAYITGVEGGAAFLAGLRYGKGTIYRKTGETAPIYWQGPSAGLDFGAEGSRSLFLVYNLDDPYAIYGRFSGIGGQAYVAGGVGLNVLGKGGIVMVPIRSGVGLRLGANLAYVKFTERQTWNPF